MSDLQTLSDLLASRRNYIWRVNRPLGVGDPVASRVVIEHTPGEAFLTFSHSEVKKFPSKVIEEMRHYYGSEESDLPKPDPRIRRPVEGKWEGYCAWFKSWKGDLDWTVFSGDIPCEDGSILDDTSEMPPGFLIGRIADDEIVTHGRYRHWRSTHEADKLPKEGIPPIEFLDRPHHRVMLYLESLLDQITPLWRHDPIQKWKAVDWLIDWLLWGLGHPLMLKCPTDLWDGQAHERVYQCFSARYFYLFPYDYLGALLERLSDEYRQIPPQIPMRKATELANRIFPSQTSLFREQPFVDPETGTGRLLMTAAQHTYDLIGISTNPFLAKIALINLYLWAPWGIYPFRFLDRPYSDQMINNCLGKALTVVRSKRLTDFFSLYTPALVGGEAFQPIQFWQPRIQVRSTLTADDIAQMLGLPPVAPTQKLSPSPEELMGLPPGVEVLPTSPIPNALPFVTPQERSSVEFTPLPPSIDIDERSSVEPPNPTRRLPPGNALPPGQ